MLRTYFKTAFRNIVRNKAFSFINILGLSIGISAALVIFLIAQYDFSFDKFHKNGDRIYRITSDFNFAGEVYKNSGVTSPLGNALRKEATGMEVISPFRLWTENETITVPSFDGHPKTELKNDHKTIFADEGYFKLIPYQWVAGNPSVSLNEPNQVVLTEKAVQLYFPKMAPADIIGKEIVFDDTVRTTVTGIVKNIEEHTDFNFSTFVSRITLEKTSLRSMDRGLWNNTNGNSQVFVQLAPQTSISSIEKQADALYEKYQKKDENDHSKHAFKLQPLSDLHFNAEYDNFGQRTANKNTLIGLLLVAAFLLLLGCINFINLTTAQGSQRAKEIGIRKTMGSSKKQLIFQFLSETFFITLIATLFSLALTPLLLKIFSDFIPPELHFNLLEQPLMIAFMLALVFVVTILSGFYPAWVLSAFRTVNVLKNQTTGTGKSRKVWMRKSLTVTQFIIAQFFILATIVVSQQIHYTLSKDLGFQKNAIVYFDINYRDTVKSHKTILVEKIKVLPGVKTLSLSTGTPSSNNSWSSTFKYTDGKKEKTTDVELKFCDTGYLRQFQLKLLAGSNVAVSDTVIEFMINETYAKLLGFAHPADAIGKKLEWDNKMVPITGVLADFHQKSLHEVIKPLAIGNWGKEHRVFAITLQPQTADGNGWKATIAQIEKIWKGVYPKYDFEYTFLDETIAKYYKSEQQISSLLKWATGLAILISCMGLLGLVIYTTNQRTKEIGVRKVLGASVSQIITILTKDFLLLIIVAFFIAAPVAWWVGHNWLENFAYRTGINIWLFIGAGLLTVTIALITISFQTFKAASANPVDSLRTE